MHTIVDATTIQLKPHSGIGEYTRNLLINMVKKAPQDRFTFILFEGDSPFDKLAEDHDNLSIHRIGAIPGKLGLAFLYWTRLRPALSQILKTSENEENLYFSLYYQNGFPISGVKTVLAVYDFAMPQFNYYSDRGKLMNTIRKTEYWYHMDRSQHLDGIITPSENTAFDYMKYYPNYDSEKIFPIMLGVEVEEVDTDTSKYLSKDVLEKGYFIYMGGGIQSNKNSGGVVRAYANFIERFLALEGNMLSDAPYLVIAGKIFMSDKFPASKALRELISSLGLKDKVIFTGYYEEKEKYSLLKKSLAFIHLSLFEGFGIAVAEAMKVGKPVIVHGGTSYPEVVGDAGFLVVGTDAEKVGEVIYKLYTDPGLALEIGLKGKERSKIFTWEQTAVETLKVLRKIVAEGEEAEE